ncbi:MAG: class II aldolase, partial [Acidiphilium sp. 37-67-22]
MGAPEGSELESRRALIAACQQMNVLGINQGNAGNISVRHGDAMLISPSATPYHLIEPDMVAAMPVAGEYGAWQG